MRHIKHTAQLVLQLVGGPVAAAHNAAAGQAVVAQAACPHDLGAGVIIFGVLHQNQRILFHGAQNANGDIVGHIIVFFIGEKALHGVHHNIGAAAGRLVIRQGVGEGGVHNSKAGAAQIAAVGAL